MNSIDFYPTRKIESLAKKSNYNDIEYSPPVQRKIMLLLELCKSLECLFHKLNSESMQFQNTSPVSWDSIFVVIFYPYSGIRIHGYTCGDTIPSHYVLGLKNYSLSEILETDFLAF